MNDIEESRKQNNSLSAPAGLEITLSEKSGLTYYDLLLNMQHSSAGYRGGIRIGHHCTHGRHIDSEEEDHLCLSNTNSDDREDNNCDMKHPQVLSAVGVSSDFELAIRNLRPSVTRRKKKKQNLNVSQQKADLPQLDVTNEDNHNGDLNESRDNPNGHSDRQERQWFPKPDVGYVDPDDFIRHNHVESQKRSQINETIAPPALLTANPPVGVSTRPTAIIAPAIPTRPMSTLFTSNSSIKKATSESCTNLYNSFSLKSKEQLQLTSSVSSAFQPIGSLYNSLQKQSLNKSAPVLMDIPQHKALEPGQQLNKVHISHPQSPSIVHLMLREDFKTACRLLREMAAHSELQTDNVPAYPFKAQVNRLCACCHEGKWFRCRILEVSPDFSKASVVYLDWGMTILTQLGPKHIRRLPHEFYTEPACSVMCHLDGVSDSCDSISSDIISQCIALLSGNEYDVIVNGYDSTTGGKIILSANGRIINDQIRQLLATNIPMTTRDEGPIEQFRHELPLAVGDEVKALLSSFSGKDDSFYVLLVNEHTVAVDLAMSEVQEDDTDGHSKHDAPPVGTLVAARYTDDGKWYRAWVKSICLQRQQVAVFFVDFGNESSVGFADIRSCPESIRSLPWLGIRVRLMHEAMSYDELTAFWKITESNYIWIRVLEILKDSYAIQVKVDYTVLLRQERMKLLSSSRFVHSGVQAMPDKRSLSNRCSSNSTDVTSCFATPAVVNQSQISNETLLRNLFEMISNELRRVRHRIDDGDEASQDRHSQLKQLLLSIFNSNNSNSQNRL